MASLCDPETPSTYLQGKQKPEPIQQVYPLQEMERGQWVDGDVDSDNPQSPRDRHRAYSWPNHLLSAPPQFVLRSKNFPLEGESLRVPGAGAVPLPALCSRDPAHLLELLGFVLVGPLEEVEQDDVT